MAKLFDYNATIVTPITDGTSIAIPLTPARVDVGSVIVNVPNVVPRYVQVNATIGIRGDAGTGSILFRIRRGGTEIYYSLIGLESGFERFALSTLLAVDGNSPPGPQVYTVSVERFTAGLTAFVIGPVEITASSFG
ncbi:hypothetical protein [Cohnella hongkongensis]|uniref:Exosporium protein C n=1 Tax=Cohnella hongkongensis TaxID=178337 RepID=A0ABV9FL68_9BACL